MNKMIKLLTAALAFIASVVSTAVHAALPAGVATGIADAQANITEAGGLILVVATVIAGIFWVRRILR